MYFYALNFSLSSRGVTIFAGLPFFWKTSSKGFCSTSLNSRTYSIFNAPSALIRFSGLNYRSFYRSRKASSLVPFGKKFLKSLNFYTLILFNIFLESYDYIEVISSSFGFSPFNSRIFWI